MPLDTFGGGVTHPADISFKAVTMVAPLTLNWPGISTASDDVIARIMEVNPEIDGLTLTLPDATQVSVGQDILISNVGDADVTVLDSSGASIASVPSGSVKYFYLTNNTSAAGAWSVVQFGVGSSSADASLLAGLGLKAIGATLNQKYDVIETTSDLDIRSSDRARLYAYTGGSHTVTLPTSASVGADFFFLMKNGGAGTITVQPSGSDVIDGSASLLIQPNDGLILYSAGASNKWYTVALGRSVQFAFTQLQKNVGGATQDIVLTSSEAQNKVITFTGTLVQSINVIVPNTVSVYYLFNNTQGNFALTVKTADGTGIAVTQGARDIAVCDGTDIRRGVDNTSATTLFSVGSAGAPSITFVTDPDSGFYDFAANTPAISGGGHDVMRFAGQPGAVNTFVAKNAPTGDAVVLTVDGSDANADMLFKAKGSGKVIFEDVDFEIRNSADTTKAVIFDCEFVTTDTTRTLTVPDASGVIVLDTATQTLTNKTIDSPIFSGAQPVEAQPAPLGNVVTCPTGAVLPFVGGVAPAGWLFCYGQAVSRTTYARLFAIIGTAFGAGDGVTTFNVPDLRGRVIAGADNMGGTGAGRLNGAYSGGCGGAFGNAGGEQGHSISGAEVGVHSHGVSDPGHAHSYSQAQFPGGNGVNTAAGLAITYGGATTSTNGTGISIQNGGGGQPHNTVQPTLVMNYIIKG